MTKQEKRLLRKYAFALTFSPYRRLYLTYLAQRRCYFEKVLNIPMTNTFDNDVDYDYYLSMYNVINKESCNIENLTILYAMTCKVYAERIKKYGVYAL